MKGRKRKGRAADTGRPSKQNDDMRNNIISLLPYVNPGSATRRAKRASVRRPPLARQQAAIRRHIAQEAALLALGYGRPVPENFPNLCALLKAARDEFRRQGEKPTLFVEFAGRRYRARIEGFDRIVIYAGRQKLASTTCWAL